MGSSSSRVAKAGTTAARQYPKRAPGHAAPTTHSPSTSIAPSSSPTSPSAPAQNSPGGPQIDSTPTSEKTSDIQADASDPHLASRLRTIGPVRPTPHYSPTSSSPLDPHPDAIASPPPSTPFPSPPNNPALAILEARQRLANLAEEEYANIGKPGFAGREFVDAVVLRQVLLMREEGRFGEAEIERRLGLKTGVARRLGARGVVQALEGNEWVVDERLNDVGGQLKRNRR